MSVYTLLLYFAYFILSLLGLILLITILPIKIASETNVNGINFNERVEFSILLGFLGGTLYLDMTSGSFQLLLASIPVFSTKWVNEEEVKDEEIETKRKPDAKKRRNSRLLFGQGKRLLRSLLRRVKLRLDLDLVAGLSDPYICGLIFGFVYPVIHFIELYCTNCSVSVTPVFTEETFIGRFFFLVQFTPILFVYPLLQFFLSREFRAYLKSGGDR
jgi:hypothetical protein